MSNFAVTPEPPYYAVIFSSQRCGDDAEYEAVAKRMSDLAARQPGYLGAESARHALGFGITVSYWRDVEAIRAWKRDEEHLFAQSRGRDSWYESYQVRISKVERHYGMISACKDDLNQA